MLTILDNSFNKKITFGQWNKKIIIMLKDKKVITPNHDVVNSNRAFQELV